MITSLLFLSYPLLSLQVDPAVEAWRRNLDGTTGHSHDSNVHNAISNIEADVTRDRFTPAHVWVDAAGIPSHEIGPWGQNPNMASDQNWVWRIPLNPTPAPPNNRVDVWLGQIGVAVNGVPFYGPHDAFSYLGRGVWYQNANVFEAMSFDVGLGHPQQRGAYHYHQAPRLLLDQRGHHAAHHSLIMGFAFDGYPVYGPFGFANVDGSGGVRRIETSYSKRSMTQRDTLPDGTALAPYYWGPDVSAAYPLGCYIQDYEFISGMGDLDECNGRFTVTPEYPDGIYAYFMSENAQGNSIYPYIIGQKYYGTIDGANQGPGGGHSNVPGHAVDFEGFAIYANNLVAGGQATVAIAGAVPQSRLYLAYSAGPGPTSTPWGEVALDAQFNYVGPMNADANGELHLQITLPAVLAGQTIFYQAASFTSAGAEFSQPNRSNID